MTTTRLSEFPGRHAETGTLANALACRGARAPHTGQPYTEALLLGISGGITFGYFTFEYTGYLPHVALLTRNTFDPWQTLLERLALPHEVRQTTNPKIGRQNLLAALDAGHAAIVWADTFSLPYTNLPFDARNWAVGPVLVVGQEGDDFLIADGSARPFRVPAAALEQARGRVKQDRFRVITLDPPDPARLAPAVQKGLWQCLSLFTEAPPRGSRTNFGFAAYAHWAGLLTNQRSRQSWARYFPPGQRLFHALAGSPHQPGAYHWIMTRGAGPGAERGVFADFLEEAAAILQRPAVAEAGAHFRRSQAAWETLAGWLLPADVPLLGEAAAIIAQRHHAYVTHGPDALDTLRRLDARHRALLEQSANDFPWDAGETAARRAAWADQVLAIRDLEQAGVQALQTVLA